MPQFICLLARDGRVLRANRTVERWKLGIDIKDVGGNYLHDVLHRSCSNYRCYLSHLPARVASVLATSKRVNVNVWDPVLKRQFLIRAHKPVPARQETSSLNEVFAVVTIDDLTEIGVVEREFIEPALALKPRAGQERRKPADAEQLHSRVIDALNNTPSFFAMADAGAALYFLNPAGRALLGLGSEEDVHGMSLLDCYAPRVREQLTKSALPTAARDGTWSGESVLLARDGREIRTTSLIVAHHRGGGQLASFSVQEQDMTERVRAEADASTQGIAFADSVSAGGVVHDFSNIVAAIMDNVELACRDVGAEHPAFERLEEIRKASRRARDLVQRIPAFGRTQEL